nr:protein ZAR1-like [Dasypus novemcinctus]
MGRRAEPEPNGPRARWMRAEGTAGAAQGPQGPQGRGMERLVRLPCAFYPGCQPAPPEAPRPAWRQSPAPPAFLARPGLLLPAPGPGPGLDGQRRAQLKAVLAHMNPGLGLRPWRVPTRDAAVQVSPRHDRAVQCSLGPRTLRSRSPRGRGERPAEPAPPRPAPPRPPPPGAERAAPEPLRAPDAAGGPAGTSAHLRPTTRFQCLDPKYGYFHCKDCKTRWESAYVWCISGTNKVYFKQLCRKCQKSFNPYRVEAIQCQTCSKSHCSCPQKKRHVDLRRPHRQELCGRCKDKRFSCGSTVSSFSYIM